MSTLVVLRNPLPSPSSSVLIEPHWVVGQTTSPCPGTSSATTPTSFTSSAINQVRARVPAARCYNVGRGAGVRVVEGRTPRRVGSTPLSDFHKHDRIRGNL